MNKKPNVAVNQIYGQLIVTAKIPTKGKYSQWSCKCTCGEEIITTGDKLTRGRKLSCGCRRKLTGNKHGLWSGYREISQTFYKRIQAGAKRREIEMEVSIEELWNLFLRQNRRCALSGILLKFALSTKDECTASLDRIDSTKNYTKDNVQWVHKDINNSKWDFEEQYFQDLCKSVADYTDHNKSHWFLDYEKSDYFLNINSLNRD
ncbi:MAG TPA: hypothetical protein PLD02_09425 [Saprospiraceae bacterium]|nr:hypothetical protein [Saprospiraceae bacterium]